MKSRLPLIAYISQDYPSLTTTFTYREVIGLRKLGWDIITYSIWKPSLDELSAEAKPLVAETFYTFPLKLKDFLKAHLYYVLRNPIKYLNTLALVLSQPQETLKKRKRTLAHFGEAVYLARLMQRQGIRHVHATFAHTASVALIISKLTGLTFSFTGHAVDVFSANRILLPLKIKTAKFIITISEYNRQYLSEIAGNSSVEGKIHIVHYGLDLRSFSPIAEKEERTQTTILSIGRLVEKKGFPYLIKACKILAEKGYKFSCQIIGEGPNRPLLQSMIEEHGLSKFIELVGVVFQERIREYFHRADIFVLPCVIASDGDRDGIPNVLIEAMAMEIPVISTKIIGIPELIKNGKEGFLVPQKEEVALADAMALLLENKDIRQRFGKAGRKRIEAYFNLSKTSAELSEIFFKELNN
ncbi:MAG: glycosyltransferase [Candidatus Hodarchaeota archaeon]